MKQPFSVWLMCMATQKTGWTLEYIKALPLYQLLQLVAGWLVWEGNDLKWVHAGGDRRRLRKILYSDECEGY